jgi:hypothetical protein
VARIGDSAAVPAAGDDVIDRVACEPELALVGGDGVQRGDDPAEVEMTAR